MLYRVCTGEPSKRRIYNKRRIILEFSAGWSGSKTQTHEIAHWDDSFDFGMPDTVSWAKDGSPPIAGKTTFAVFVEFYNSWAAERKEIVPEIIKSEF